MFGLEIRELLIAGGAVLLGLMIVVLFLKSLLGGGRKRGKVKKAAELREFLDEYPPTPPPGRGSRLWVDGVPARLRLVVVVPTGMQQEPITADDVPELLNAVLRGLGGCVAADKPRIRVGPPQLSVAGFAPTFFRNVESPDADGDPSIWVRLAGPAKARGKPVLVGLALLTEEETDIGSLALEPNEWVHHLSIEK